MGGQTLATLRDDATKEFNGTSTNSLRVANGSRLALAVCVTGDHELAKIAKHVVPEKTDLFNDWAIVSLTAAAGHAVTNGGFCCIAQKDHSDHTTALVLIA